MVNSYVENVHVRREQLVYSVDLAEVQKWQTIVSILSQTEVSTL